ncbi:MAG: large subunit ribosomal protein [Patescibacteria group bacterium]|nr:large subunit ribosomal protein [Patescibacteria group bacterium]
MSRIGKKEISIPQGVTVALDKGVITVKGPKGEIKKDFNVDLIKINIESDKVTSEPIRNDKFSNAIWGTYMSHIENMILGSEKAFEKKLIIEGVGFKWEVKGDKLQLNVGFSHPVFIDVPKDLSLTIEKGNLTISGIDKEAVSRFAMQVRKVKKGEPYKGKGIRYVDEVIRRKQGKKSA